MDVDHFRLADIEVWMSIVLGGQALSTGESVDIDFSGGRISKCGC